MTRYYIEEDLFPREIANWEERPYGYLFFNENNKDSFDSNHALIYRSRIDDIDPVLEDLIRFYRHKGIRPAIYQSICDEGYFTAIESKLSSHGFDSWTEAQRYMVLAAPNTIRPNGEVSVYRAAQWLEEYGEEIFIKAGEPWEIDVAKRALHNENALFFVACIGGRPVGMTHAHITNGVCRVDYLLVAKEHRNKGVGRSLIARFADHCRENRIDHCYLWPDGETAEKIYREAGFRYVETKLAGRACLRAD